jgi:lipid A oxidase
MRALISFAAAILVLSSSVALAEFQLSIYGGANTVGDSDVELDTGAGPVDFDASWEGNSFEMPPYWGARGTYWLTGFNAPRWGVGVDFTHAKAEADIDAVLGAAFSNLKFTHGLNSVTLNGMYRAPLNSRFTLYAGAGAGASIPHVEVDTIAPVTSTFEYQLTGPVVQGLAGASVGLGRRFSLFSEYKASYSWNDVDLNGGGSLETDLLVHHFALGLSYSFGAPPAQ